MVGGGKLRIMSEIFGFVTDNNSEDSGEKEDGTDYTNQLQQQKHSNFAKNSRH